MSTHNRMQLLAGSAAGAAAAAFEAFERSHVIDGYDALQEWTDRRFADQLEHVPPSDDFIYKLSGFLADLPICYGEVRGATGLPEPVVEAIARRLVDLEETRWRRPRAYSVGEPPVPLSVIQKKVLPLDLRFLPDTAADPEDGDEYTAPDGRIGRRLLMFKSKRFRLLASVGVIVYMSYYPFGKPSRFVRDLENLEDLFESTGEDCDDPEAVARVMYAYFVEKTLFPEHTDSARRDTVQRLYALHALLKAYCSGKPDHRVAITKILPTLPSQTSAFHTQHASVSRVIRDAQDDNKKMAGANLLADNFDDVLAAVRVRTHQARQMDWHCERAATKMLECKEDGEFRLGGSLDFFYRERVVRPDGLRLAFTQRIYMRARRAKTICVKSSKEEIVFEFLHVESDSGTSHAPWFIEVFTTGTLIAPIRLTPKLRDLRRTALLGLDLPPLNYKPAGLVAADGKASAALMAEALIMGIVLIPTRAFAHAMLIVMVMVRVMALSFCRIGEAMQITVDSDGWVTKHLYGKSYQLFLAIPKCWEEEEEFVLNDRTMQFIKQLIKMTKSREDDGKLKVAPTNPNLSALKRKSARYLFAFRGRHLREEDMNYMFRFMTLGLGKFRSHDIRHAAANRADHEKLDMKVIARLMRYKGNGVGQAPHYAKHTPTQRRAAQNRYMDLLELEDSLRGSASDECPPAGVVAVVTP